MRGGEQYTRKPTALTSVETQPSLTLKNLLSTFLRCHADIPQERRRTVARYFFQEYLESSLRYLHHKFVEDVNGHRTDNIKVSTCNLYLVASIVWVILVRTARAVFLAFNSCAALYILLSSH